MRANLYRVIGGVPDGFCPTPAQADILENWNSGNNLFTMSQIASRNGIKRGQAQRQIKGLIKVGAVEIHFRRVKI